ncbi:hypothetical protein HZB60_00940 [candidate division KSB1 bacterium]|nr:hypothetical protein [candidate division KSB1 bacterium]
MIRPVEQHERLHPKEYLDRVRKAEGTPEVEPRDFSYVVREADQRKHDQSSGSEFGADSYEASDQQSGESPADEQQQPHPDERDPRRPADDGSLDVTV